MSSTPSLSRAQAFTLVELLVVVAIIALLLGILLPALNRARKLAVDVQGKSNLRQIFTAQTEFAADHNDDLVPFADKDFNGGFEPSWPGSAARYGNVGLGDYVPFEEEEGGTDVFRCPQFEAEVTPRFDSRFRNDMNYSLNGWTSLGNILTKFPPFGTGVVDTLNLGGSNSIVSATNPGVPRDGFGPRPRMSDFPRPFATFFAMDGNLMSSNNGPGFASTGVCLATGGPGILPGSGPRSPFDPETIALFPGGPKPPIQSGPSALPYYFQASAKHDPDDQFWGVDRGELLGVEGHLGSMNFVCLDGHVTSYSDIPPLFAQNTASFMAGGFPDLGQPGGGRY